MYVLVVYLPLISAIVVGFFGRYLGRAGAGVLSSSLIGTSFVLGVYAFYEVALLGSKSSIKIMSWFSSGLLSNSWGFLFDTVTVVMLLVVLSISFLVHVYSMSYMYEDPHIIRFMSYLSLFTFFMLCLVTADNFAQMFLGWEGVGLASYLLINFWYTRIQANKAALKAVIVNRFGDFGLSLGILGIFYVFRTLDFNCVFSLVYAFKDHSIFFCGYEVNSITLISLLLFIGAIGKSAQLGLHTWLPDAMEGPTPVSALIHAATMVTAGVFVLIRCSPILEYSVDSLVIISIFGALTAFFAGTIGIFQNDLKRVIAYSTCSQLGYMVFACGLSNYSVGMFHLMNHAFFKALLFLSAGSVIHAMMDEQDMRRMGGLVHLLPLTFIMFLVGSLALMGFPFTTGFYSKDVILELAYSNYYVEGFFTYWLGVLAAFCTAFYSFRLIYLTFLSETNSYKGVIKHVHDAPGLMAFPLIVLFFGSVFVGYIFKDMFIGLGTDFWNNSILNYNSLNDLLILEAEFLSAHIKLFPVIISLIGGVFSLIIYHYFSYSFYSIFRYKVIRSVYSFFNKKWYFDLLYNNYLVNKVLSFGYNTSFKTLDRGAIELIGPTGIVRFVSKFIKLLSEFQSGYIYNYVFVMVLGVVALILIIGSGSSFFIGISVYNLILFIVISAVSLII